jgi:hypothetical protein
VFIIGNLKGQSRLLLSHKKTDGKYYAAFLIDDGQEQSTQLTEGKAIRILSTNTDGQSEFQACGKTVKLVGTCTQKRVSEEHPIFANCFLQRGMLLLQLAPTGNPPIQNPKWDVPGFCESRIPCHSFSLTAGVPIL